MPERGRYMKHFILALAMASILAPVAPTIAEAGSISRACVKSDRKAANRRLCNCIERAARKTLSSSDQRLAATFFNDPHKSQEIRQSDRSSHEKFWLRYKKFGVQAQQMCSWPAHSSSSRKSHLDSECVGWGPWPPAYSLIVVAVTRMVHVAMLHSAVILAF